MQNLHDLDMKAKRRTKSENHKIRTIKSQGKRNCLCKIYVRSSRTSSHPFSNPPSSRKFCRMTPAEVPELALPRDLNGK